MEGLGPEPMRTRLGRQLPYINHFVPTIAGPGRRPGADRAGDGFFLCFSIAVHHVKHRNDFFSLSTKSRQICPGLKTPHGEQARLREEIARLEAKEARVEALVVHIDAVCSHRLDGEATDASLWAERCYLRICDIAILESSGYVLYNLR